MKIKELIRKFTDKKEERIKILREIYEYLILNRRKIKDLSELTLKFLDSPIYQNEITKICSLAFDYLEPECIFCGGKVRVFWENPFWTVECEKCGFIYDED